MRLPRSLSPLHYVIHPLGLLGNMDDGSALRCVTRTHDLWSRPARSETATEGLIRKGSDHEEHEAHGVASPAHMPFWNTTMDSQTRTILRVTMEDAVLAEAIFQMSMADEVEPRRLFIEQNAKFAGNLDI